MGKRGPPKSPTSELAARGSRHAKNRADYHPNILAASALLAATPDMPIDLPPRAVEAWNYYAPLLAQGNVLQDDDAMALEMLCLAYSDYKDADDFVRENGLAYDLLDEKGNQIWKPYPQVAQREAAHARCFRMMREFGLTPSSRASLPPRVPAKVQDGTKDEQIGEFD